MPPGRILPANRPFKKQEARAMSDELDSRRQFTTLQAESDALQAATQSTVGGVDFAPVSATAEEQPPGGMRRLANTLARTEKAMQAIIDGKVLEMDRSTATEDEIRLLREIRWRAALVLMHCCMIVPVYLAAQIITTLRLMPRLQLGLGTLLLIGAAYACDALWVLLLPVIGLLLLLSPLVVIRVQQALGWLPPRRTAKR
jgi:hypothetical protein